MLVAARPRGRGRAGRAGPYRYRRQPSPAGRTTRRYRPGTNVLETVLATAPAGGVSIVDLLPWPGPGLSVAGSGDRAPGHSPGGSGRGRGRGPPGGAWRPAREVAAFDGGLVVDDLVVRTGFPLRFEPLGRDTPRWRGVSSPRARRSLRRHPRTGRRRAPAVDGVGPAGCRGDRGGLAQLAGADQLTTARTGRRWSAACWRCVP